MANHPSTIAKFYAGLIIESALNEGWEPPGDTYSVLKRTRIISALSKLADKLKGLETTSPKTSSV